MELTQSMIQYCETQPWDADLRQAVYVKVLESPDIEVNNSWLARIYHNLRTNKTSIEKRRKELEVEFEEDIRLHTVGEEHEYPDPLELLIALEEYEDSVKVLSPLLRATLELLIRGVPVAVVADREGVAENTIYQRIHQAKINIEENNNE